MKKMKQAQVTPLYKKNDPLEKINYRPVSVLPILSKLYEKVLEIQLSDFFEKKIDPYLCGFRRGHGCQTNMILKEKLNEKKHHKKIIYRVKCHEVNSQMLWRGPLKQQLCNIRSRIKSVN
jgi:hypothetical protein